MKHSIKVSYGHNQIGDTITQFYWPSLNEVKFYQLRPDEFTDCTHERIIAIFRIKERKQLA
jgi:hypothetical protein